MVYAGNTVSQSSPRQRRKKWNHFFYRHVREKKYISVRKRASVSRKRVRRSGLQKIKKAAFAAFLK